MKFEIRINIDFIIEGIFIFYTILLIIGCKKDENNLINKNLVAKIYSGDLQTGFLGEKEPNSIIILVTEKNGTPYNNAIVEYIQTKDNGLTFYKTLTKGFQGQYPNNWLLGCSQDRQTLTAIVYDSMKRFVDTLHFSALGINYKGWKRSCGFIPQRDGSSFSYSSARAIKKHPNGSLFMIADSVYESLDQGRTWFSLSNFPGGWFMRPSTLCITDAGVILIGSDFNGIYKSMDNGFSWIRSNNGIESPNYISNLIQIGNNDLYCETERYHYRSKDNGDNWTRTNLILNKFARLPNNTLFTFNNSLLVSYDDGETWKPISSKFIDVTDLEVDDRGNLLLIEMEEHSRPTLYKSIDGGLNWVKIASFYVDKGHYYSCKIQCYHENYYVNNINGINKIDINNVVTNMCNDLPYDKRSGNFIVIDDDKILLNSDGIFYNF